MSKEITALLLKNKIDKVKNPKEYLINCLRNQGLIKEETSESKIVSHDTCKLCNSSDFIFNKHEKICNECGAIDTSVSDSAYKTYKQNISFTKGTFIEPGTTLVKIIKNGVEVTRDLARTNTFISQDPEEKRLKANIDKLNEILDSLVKDYNPMIFDKIRDEISSVWYNILLIKPEIRGRERLALLAWSIYYPIVYNNLNINIQKLATIIGVQVGDIYSYNFVMKDIFEGTQFEKYISVPIGTETSIDLSPNYLSKIKLIKKDLKDYLSNPIKAKEEYGIVYYLSNKIFKDRKYTSTFLSEKLNLSPNVILLEASKIEKFYNKNVGKRTKLTL